MIWKKSIDTEKLTTNFCSLKSVELWAKHNKFPYMYDNKRKRLVVWYEEKQICIYFGKDTKKRGN